MLITFSGLDGSGKTTLIRQIKRDLEEMNCKVQVQTMYDNLGFYSFVRRARDAFGGNARSNTKNGMRPDLSKDPGYLEGTKWNGEVRDPKIGAMDKEGFLKKVIYGVARSRLVKRLVLFLDLFIFVVKKRRLERGKNFVLITDRYLYDSLVDVADLKGDKWGFIRMFLKLVPKPDVPVFVDVPADVAFERKHEYPIAYNRWRRDTYLKLFSFVENASIISNDDLSAATVALRQAVGLNSERYSIVQ